MVESFVRAAIVPFIAVESRETFVGWITSGRFRRLRGSAAAARFTWPPHLSRVGAVPRLGAMP